MESGASGSVKGRSCSPGGDLGYHTLPAASWGSEGPKRCPFDRLPDDLLLRVLGFLASDQLCCCARVCRRWYFLAWEPQLWTSVVLASERLPVDQGQRLIRINLFSAFHKGGTTYDGIIFNIWTMWQEVGRGGRARRGRLR